MTRAQKNITGAAFGSAKMMQLWEECVYYGLPAGVWIACPPAPSPGASAPSHSCAPPSHPSVPSARTLVCTQPASATQYTPNQMLRTSTGTIFVLQ
jgi:hypothetical protein